MTGAAGPTRGRTWRWLAWIAAAGACGAGGWFAWTSQAPRDPPRPAARTVAIERGPMEVVVAASGTFELEHYVDVGAQLSGQLLSVLVNAGDPVRRGQLVATIDDRAVRARLAQLEAQQASTGAQIEAKRAQIEHGRVQRERYARLVAEGHLAAATLDETRALVASLEAEVEALRAQAAGHAASIDQARTELRFAEVRAPMSGTVISVSTKPGQTLNAAQQAPTILRIGDLRSLRLVANVSEADIVHVRPGMPVRFRLLGAADTEHAGRVRDVLPAPRLVNNVVFYDVVVEPSRPSESFRIGMTAQAFLVLARHACMARIPRVALPADLRPPQRVALTVVEPDTEPRTLKTEVTAADDTHAGVPCGEADRLGLARGALVQAMPPKKKGK